jgi:acyl-CoA dehydrogenase
MHKNANDTETTIHDRVRQFVKTKLDPVSLQVDLEGHIPEEIVDQMRAMKLFGLVIPEEYGGLGLSTLDEIMVYEELTQANSAFRSRIGTSNGIGSLGILFDGTQGQKDKYLPRVASGEWTAAFGLTEPNAGSDAAGIATTAVLDNDHWVVNGNKVFITNGDCADFFTVIVVTDEEKRARGGFTALIVERDTPGFSNGPADDKMGIKGSQTTELIFKDCRVPRDNVIGGMAMVGQGFQTAMRVLDKGRLTMGACALGASQRLLDLCVNHVKAKKENGKSWDDLQADQFLLADMATEIYAMRQMLYHSAQLRDQGQNITYEASMVKVFCTEVADRLAVRALDIFGEEGYLKKAQVEMYLRDVRLYRIFEGTSEIQRIVISRKLLKD